MKRRIVIVVAAVFLWPAAAAQATHVSCGQRITTDTVLDSDLDCPTSSGIEIAASGVDLDLNGHTVRGETDSFRSSLGIWAYQNYSDLSVRNGTVIGFGSSIYLYGVRNSTVSNMHVQGRIFVGGQPTNNLIANNVVTPEANQFPERGIEVDESFYFNNETFRPAYNRVLNNTTPAVTVSLADRNEVRGNHVVHGEILITGSGRVPDFFEGNGADENVVADNQIDSAQILLAQACQRNVVEGNEISGSQPRGVLVTVGCADNTIRDNIVSGATSAGIQLGDPPYRTARNVVERNVVTGGGDGIAARNSADHSILRNNQASRNGDDGIDVEDPTATVAGNAAFANGDWGIVAVPGVTDGAGNLAWSNGQAPQCLNIVCGRVSGRCRVRGSGTILAANGDDARFDVNVHATGNQRPNGHHAYRDFGPAERLTVSSRTIDAITCTPDGASIFGTARTRDSRQPVGFRLDVGESPDTYRIRLDTGYDSGTAVVSSGSIRIH